MPDCASLECLVGSPQLATPPRTTPDSWDYNLRIYCTLTCTVYDLIMKLHNVACTMVICYFVDKFDDDTVDQCYNEL